VNLFERGERPSESASPWRHVQAPSSKESEFGMSAKRNILSSAIGLVVVLTASGVAVASSGGQGLVTANDVLQNSAANINMSATGGTPVTIVSEKLAAGSWIISGTATVVNFGPSDYTRCDLAKGNSHLVQGSTMVGNPNLAGSMGPGAYMASVSAIGTITSTTAFTARLRCFHDTSTPSGDPVPYVDSDAALWAHRSS
jgi:hypothetical protein